MNLIYIYWKNFFDKLLSFFRIYADFEADNENDNSSIGKRTTNIFKQNPILNGHHIISELEDVLKNGSYESSLGYDNVDWFVIEVIKLENKKTFYFKNTKKDNNMTEKDEKDYRNNNLCRFCEKNIESDKIRDHCHLIGKNRRPAHKKFKIIVTQG